MGATNFMLLLWLGAAWHRHASNIPIAGNLFARSVHGVLSYFTAEQVVGEALLGAFSIPLALFGMLLLPKTITRARGTWFAARIEWTLQDPSHMQRWGYPAGILIALGAAKWLWPSISVFLVGLFFA